MPLRRVKNITIDEFDEDAREMWDELVRINQEFVDKLSNRTIQQCKRLARRDMPSSGGSYLDTLYAKANSITPFEVVYEIGSTHPWAIAVEYGTSPHPIPSKGINPNLMTTKTRSVLPVKGGKDRPYGMKYGDTVITGYYFEHPGARAFHIISRGEEWALENWEDIYNTVWGNNVT